MIFTGKLSNLNCSKCYSQIKHMSERRHYLSLCKRHREIGHLQKSWREIADNEAASSKIIISIISISLSVAIMSDEKIKKVNVFFVHSICHSQFFEFI